LLHTLAFLGGGVALLLRRYLKASGREREQFKYLLAGIIGMFGWIVLTNFILPAFFKTTDLLPFGPAYTLFFSISFTYAIIRHRLLDIRAVVARSVAYALLLGTLAIAYGTGVFAITTAFFPNSGTQSRLQMLISIALAIVLAFTFQPLRRFFEKLTDRIFFREHYDSQEVLNARETT
jgi:hypothetical protein